MEPMKETQMIKALNNRRTTRSYKPDNIPEDYINQILKAAQLSPTYCDSQPIDFCVIRDTKKIDIVSDKILNSISPEAKQSLEKRVESYKVKNVITCDAPVVILLLKNKREIPTFIELDTGTTLMSIMMACMDFGLGSMCLGLFKTKSDIVEQFFNLEKNSLIIAIAIGKPSENNKMNKKEIKSNITFMK